MASASISEILKNELVVESKATKLPQVFGEVVEMADRLVVVADGLLFLGSFAVGLSYNGYYSYLL